MRQINIEIFIYILIEISIVVVVKKIRQYGVRKIFVNYIKINLNGRKYKIGAFYHSQISHFIIKFASSIH